MVIPEQPALREIRVFKATLALESQVLLVLKGIQD